MNLDETLRHAVRQGQINGGNIVQPNGGNITRDGIAIPHGVVTTQEEPKQPKTRVRLTDREKRKAIFAVIRQGQPTEVVAAEWHVSPQSVRNWVSAYRKLESERAAHARAAKKTKPETGESSTETPAALLKAVFTRIDERLTAIESRVDATATELGDVKKTLADIGWILK